MKVWVVIAGFPLALTASCERREPDGQEMPSKEAYAAPDDAAFAAAYVSAVNASNVEKFRGLLHGKCLSHITEENKDFFDAAFARELAQTIPADHKWGFVPVPEGPLALSDAFIFPVRPTHQLQIVFGQDPEHGRTIAGYVAADEGRWALVIPYPTDETLAKMRRARVLSRTPNTRGP